MTDHRDIPSASELRRLEALFHAALELPDAERHSYLTEQCGDDRKLLSTLLTMVATTERDSAGLTDGIGRLAGEISTPRDRSGEQVDRYRLEQRIRWGGMAEVYRAVRSDGEFHHEVALKIARVDRGTADMTAWFANERGLLASLQHPNICQIFDGGSTADGEPYFVMERVDGESFVATCLRPQTAWPQVLQLFLDLCAAVSYTHRQLIVHRDIKPENVMVADDGRVKLLDFGIAATLSSEASNRDGARARWYSPGYAAPEIMEGKNGGIGSDVYSLGKLLDELRERCPRHARDDLDRICAHASAEVAEARYLSVDALADDLCRLRDRQPISLRRNERGYRLRRFLQRRALPMAMGAVLLLLMVAAFAREVQQRHRIQASADQALRERDKAQAVGEFLASAYQAADPDENSGEDISVYRFLELQSASIEQDTSLDPDVRSDLLMTMGQAFLSLGRFDDSDRALALALADDRKSAGDTRGVRWARIRIAQAQSARRNDRDKEAETILSEIRDAKAEWQDDRDAVKVESNLYSTLSALSQGLSQLDLAERHIRQALDLNRQIKDRQSAGKGRVSMLVTLGSIQSARGDLQAGLTTFQEGIELIHAQGLSANVEQLALLGWLGINNSRLGRPGVAENYLREAIVVATALYPNANKKLAGAYGNLGAMLLANGRLSEAESFLDKSVEVLELLGDSGSKLMESRQGNLARLALAREDYPKTRKILLQYMKARTQRFGLLHPQTLTGRIVLLALELEEKNPAAAQAEASTVLSILDEKSTPQDQLQPIARLLAAQAQAALGHAERADDLIHQADELLAKYHADNPRLQSQVLSRRGDLLQLLGRPQAALVSYRDALVAFDQSSSHLHPDRARCLLHLARLELDVGDRVVTRKDLVEAAEILRRELVESAPTLDELNKLESRLAVR